jgi:uroporphyrinogen III methyltransferase/synthase
MSDAQSDPCIAALSGIGVLVTRDVRQSSDLTARLKALGADVFEFPVIEIAKPSSFEALDRSLALLNSYDWIVFASTNAVDSFIDRMRTLNLPHDRLANCSIAAVGAKTADSLRLRGLEVNFCPQNFSAVDFAGEFCKLHEPSQKKVLWPRTNVGKLTIKELLEEQGASVEAVIAYETVLPDQAVQRRAELLTLIQSGKIKVITLTSSQAAKNLRYLLEPPQETAGTAADDMPGKQKMSLTGISIAAIGAQTLLTVEQLFMCECFQSEDATMEGLVAVTAKHSQHFRGSP